MLCLSSLLFGCSTQKPTPGEEFQGQTAQDIFDGGELALAKGSNKDAIKHFEALNALYPFSAYEQQAGLDIIYAYFSTEDYPGAAAAADRYIHLYPRGDNVDYAYYMRGVANFDQDRGVIQRYVPMDLSQRDISTTQQSFINFNELIRRFPASPYAPDARNRMIYLRNLMAQKEVNIANFYYQRDQYVAAINRASGVIVHYQEAPQVQDALATMVKSYRKLGLTELANETLAILALNFPESEVYKDLQGK